MSRSRLSTLIIALTALIVLPSVVSAENPNAFRWVTNYDLATSLARKDNKLIMAYFSGSDWDPWTDKLEKDVFSTVMFKDWARENVVSLQIDFPRDKPLNGIAKAQNQKLKLKYNVAKVPILIFLDPTGAPIARVSYDDICLRPEEVKGSPKQAIAFLENLVKNRPKDEILKNFANFTDARLFAKKNYAVLLMAITQGHAPYWIEQRDLLFKDQQFVRWVNHNVIFISMDWPEEYDTSPAAKDFRAFAERQKLAPSPFQLVVWDVPFDKIKAKYKSFSLQHVDQLIQNIGFQLPHIDYTGNWITDYHLAQTIAAQTDRDIFMAFTSMDGGIWSKKMEDDLFKSEPFLKYAHKNFVLLRLEYPTTTTQPTALADQNKMLAEAFDIKGFPEVIVVNPKGEKLAQSGYLRGGPEVFMKQLIPICERDQDRLKALRETD